MKYDICIKMLCTASKAAFAFHKIARLQYLGNVGE